MYEKSYTVDVSRNSSSEAEIVADEFDVSIDTAKRIIKYADIRSKLSKNDDGHELLAIHEHSPNIYREASDCLMRVLHGAIERQLDSVQKWGIAFATNNPICANRSMAEIGSMLGCSKASLSYEARQFCTQHGLPPSRYMRSEATSEASRKSRKRHVNQKQNERTRDSSSTGD